MDSIFSDMDLSEVLEIILVLGVLIIVIQYLRSFSSYKINKPFAWEEAVNKNLISNELLKIEKEFKDKVRFYNLWFQVDRLSKNEISGCFAELGVYQGETAKILHSMDPNRIFYLFDTFTGFSQHDLAKEDQSDGRMSTHMFSDTDINTVKAYINGNDNLHFKPGFFPETTVGLENQIFALVNIDADLYAPTIEALRFFYPRMNNGGVIIIHDYNHNWQGVTKAVDEFLSEIPENLFELPDWQGTAMIIRNS